MVTSVVSEDNAPPQLGHDLRQMTRRELVARARYPEHFGRRDGHLNRREDGDGEGEPPLPGPSGGPSDPCLSGTLNGPGSASRRREFVGDQVLSPYEVVAFLKGRGEFVS